MVMDVQALNVYVGAGLFPMQEFSLVEPERATKFLPDRNEGIWRPGRLTKLARRAIWVVRRRRALP